MQDWYQIPALILTALLLPAFGRLYLRSRDTRTLLWFLAFALTFARMLLLYPLGTWDFNDGTHPWRAASGQAGALLSSALFLGSLSPLSFRLGKIRVLYVVPFIGPMLIYAVLSYGVFRNAAPDRPVFLVFPALCLTAVIAGLFWVRAERGFRGSAGALACLLFGGLAVWSCWRPDLHRPLVFAGTGNHVVAALLVLFVFRRFSSGVVISFLGLLGWACPVLLILPTVATSPHLSLNLIRVVILSKVVTALGLILVALENEIALNQAKGERERRARVEMEAYSRVVLARRRVEDFDRQANEICKTVVENSRFSKAALILLQASGGFRLAGSAGVDHATGKALDAFA